MSMSSSFSFFFFFCELADCPETNGALSNRTQGLLLPIQELETLSVYDDWKCSSRLRLRWSR